MNTKYIAPCGMTCCDCLFYQKEIYEAAKSFKSMIEKYDYDKFLMHFSNTNIPFFADFKKFPEFIEMLNKIIFLQCENVCMEARGCSIPNAEQKFGGLVKETHKCDVLLCIESKGYEGCWNCNEIEACEKKKVFCFTYGDIPVNNCILVRDKGKDTVRSSGSKYYIWQQRAEE